MADAEALAARTLGGQTKRVLSGLPEGFVDFRGFRVRVLRDLGPRGPSGFQTPECWDSWFQGLRFFWGSG